VYTDHLEVGLGATPVVESLVRLAACAQLRMLPTLRRQVCVDPTQVCVDPTQVYVDPTQVYVNPTQCEVLLARTLAAHAPALAVCALAAALQHQQPRLSELAAGRVSEHYLAVRHLEEFEALPHEVQETVRASPPRNGLVGLEVATKNALRSKHTLMQLPFGLTGGMPWAQIREAHVQMRRA
jgi:hypothetical protein